MESSETAAEKSAAGPILLCYDGSDGARRAIGVAAGLLGPRVAVVLDVAPWSKAFEELNEVDALNRAREGALLATEAGFAATARAELAAHTWEGIVDVADELRSPVVVVGTRALSPGREFLAGGVSHEVVLHAGRPVLVVPPPRNGDPPA
jgi:nucleotide-binding universal stress UspA family protein